MNSIQRGIGCAQFGSEERLSALLEKDVIVSLEEIQRCHAYDVHIT